MASAQTLCQADFNRRLAGKSKEVVKSYLESVI